MKIEDKLRLSFNFSYSKCKYGNHNDFGKKAEDLAADYLQKNGYKILVRNFRFKSRDRYYC
jgi:hypothetical protein